MEQWICFDHSNPEKSKMTLSLKQLFFMTCVGLLMHSCSYKPISYQPTMMHIPSASKKGEISTASAVGWRHIELQGAYAPVNRLVIQAAIYRWSRGETGNRSSNQFGVGYVLPRNDKHFFGFRALVGQNQGRFDERITANVERFGSNYRADIYMSNLYFFYTYATQVDYTLKLKNVHLFAGAQAQLANYRYVSMRGPRINSGVVVEDSFVKLSRRNFQTPFFLASFGASFKVSDRLFFKSAFENISVLDYDGNQNDAFYHSFTNFFWSNSIVFNF